jgi:hypothetical protein
VIAVPLVAACAAVVVVLLAGHGHHAPARPDEPVSPPAGAHARTLEISRVLAVFAEPSATYKAACRGAHPLAVCTLRAEGSQVRSVSAGDGYTATITPTAVTQTTRLARRGQAVVLSLQGPKRGSLQTSNPASLPMIRHRGLLISTFERFGDNRGVILVPNGVAHVTLADLRVPTSAAARTSAISISTSKVSENISVLMITGLTERNLRPDPSALTRFFISSTGSACHATFAVYALPATAQMTWRDSAGRIIRNVAVKFRLDLGINDPPQIRIMHAPRCR